MKRTEFTALIPQNTAPSKAVSIGLYDGKNQRKGGFELQALAHPNLGSKLYSFGAISDVHLPIESAEEDFRRALAYFQSYADFVCIAGDLTNSNEDSQWQQYKAITDAYNVPIYAISGNHDCLGAGITAAKLQQYTGQKLHYSFTQGDDVFIMIGAFAWASQSGGIQPFYNLSLQFLYDTLEANRNKRCFVFTHFFPWKKAGDPLGLYGSNALWGTQGTLIYNLMAHYKNALWFHGHSHHTFESQVGHGKATYDFDFGCHNIHIPSVTKPIDVLGSNRVENISGSQGYLVDVYGTSILLNGMDFISGDIVPLGLYYLQTPLQPVEAGAFHDDTGIIST